MRAEDISRVFHHAAVCNISQGKPPSFVSVGHLRTATSRHRNPDNDVSILGGIAWSRLLYRDHAAISREGQRLDAAVQHMLVHCDEPIVRDWHCRPLQALM